MLTSRIAVAIMISVGALIISCGKEAAGPGNEGPAASMLIVGGDSQAAVVGTELASPLVVKVLNAHGHAVPGQVINFRVTAGGGGVFAGVGITDAGGIAQERWTLGTTTADSQRVEARAVDNVTGAALTFAVFRAIALPAPATKLAFSTQPSAVAAGAPLSPAVRVTLQDSYGNASTTNADVTVAITSGTGAPGAVLGGTLTRAAVSGVATFGDLTIDRSGAGYTLTGTASGLSSAVSTRFSVNAGPATKLTFVVQPSDVAAGARIAPAVELAIQDAHGNTVGTAINDVSLAIAPGTGTVGATLGGTTTKAAVGGVAAFTDLTIDKAGAGFTLTARAGGVSSATSAPFGVILSPVARVTVWPVSLGIMVGDTVTLHAEAYDSANNLLSGLATTWIQPSPVGSISSTGLLSGLAPGWHLLQASIGGVSNTGGGGVTVYTPTSLDSVSLGSGLPTTMTVGSGVCIRLNTYGAPGYTVALRWTVQILDASVVNEYQVTGLPESHCVRALKSGVTTVTGSFGGRSASRAVTVP